MKNLACCLLSVVLVAGCVSSRYANDVRSIQLARSSESWNGHPLPPYKTGAPEVLILRITIPPRCTLPMHMHSVINAGVLLKGQLTVTTESGQVLRLKADDPIVEVVDTWHYGKNEGDEPAEILVFYAGIKSDSITIKKPETKQSHNRVRGSD